MKERKTELTGLQPFRIKGEANDLLGNFSDALDAYEKALSFNPKIGVQRRVNALRKKLQRLK